MTTTTDIVRAERSALCDLFEELGADAPTLCEGWTTRDLAAHLAVRERRPDALLGILGGPFAGRTKQIQAEMTEHPWEELVSLLRSGPPPVPFGMPVVAGVGSLHEWFVHHEDVRRANGHGPRTGVGDVQDAIWRGLLAWGPILTARVRGAAIELARPDGSVRKARPGGATARITGEPGELMLYLFGRRDAAEVELSGNAEAITRLERSQLGV